MGSAFQPIKSVVPTPSSASRRGIGILPMNRGQAATLVETNAMTGHLIRSHTCNPASSGPAGLLSLTTYNPATGVKSAAYNAFSDAHGNVMGLTDARGIGFPADQELVPVSPPAARRGIGVPPIKGRGRGIGVPPINENAVRSSRFSVRGAGSRALAFPPDQKVVPLSSPVRRRGIGFPADQVKCAESTPPQSQLAPLVATYTYSAFGEVLSATGPAADACPFRFSTKYYDADTGLYYSDLRYYSPTMARFLTRDPSGEENGGANLYAYCGNDPINYTDTSGLSYWDSFISAVKSGASAGWSSLSAGASAVASAVVTASVAVADFGGGTVLGAAESVMHDSARPAANRTEYYGRVLGHGIVFTGGTLLALDGTKDLIIGVPLAIGGGEGGGAFGGFFGSAVGPEGTGGGVAVGGIVGAAPDLY